MPQFWGVVFSIMHVLFIYLFIYLFSIHALHGDSDLRCGRNVRPPSLFYICIYILEMLSCVARRLAPRPDTDIVMEG